MGEISPEIVAAKLDGIKDLLSQHSESTNRQLDQFGQRLADMAEEDRTRDERAEKNKEAAIAARERLTDEVRGIKEETKAARITLQDHGARIASLEGIHREATAKRDAIRERRKGAAIAVGKISAGVVAVVSAGFALFGDALANALKKLIQ